MLIRSILLLTISTSAYAFDRGYSEGPFFSLGHHGDSDHPIQVEFLKCTDGFDTSLEWMECIKIAKKAWRIELDKAVDCLSHNDQFTATQIAWERSHKLDIAYTFHDPEHYRRETGSGGGLVASQHFMQKLSERAREVQEWCDIYGT